MADLRFLLGRIARFGIKKTLYERSLAKWDRLLPYDAFSLSEDEIRSLVGAAEETNLTVTDEEEYKKNAVTEAEKETLYVLRMPRDIECSVAIKAYMAVAAARFFGVSGRTPKLIYADEAGIYKPDWSPETILSRNYIGETLAIRADVYDSLGFDEKNPHASVLRLTDASGDDICHVRRVLTKRRTNPAAKNEDATLAVKESLKLRGVTAEVSRLSYDGDVPCYRWEPVFNKPLSHKTHERGEHDDAPLVSVIIPTRDHADILKACIDSVFATAGDVTYEIIVAENCSIEAETYDYYDEIEDIVRIIPCDCEFNFSYICNYGAAFARGRYLLFLNNDTEARSQGWMELMAEYLSIPDIAAVGAKLFYPDGTVQHGGVTVGVRGVAGHAFIGAPHDARGYEDRLVCVHNLSAVTAACMMVKADDFWEVGGFDERLAVAFNDTDLCMRLREMKKRILFLPDVCLTHYESKSRGIDEQDKKKLKRFNKESMRFQRDWFYRLVEGDPYYNPNLSYEDDTFSKAGRGA